MTESRPRARELGIAIGRLSPGPADLLTDVPGVRVGHATMRRPEPVERALCTGVTLVLPHPGDLRAAPVRAAVHTVNGYGKPLGFEQVRELGTLESPVALTGTFNVGRVADGLLQVLCDEDPGLGVAPGRASLNVVVGETNDGWLSHLPSRPVGVEEVRRAYETARAAGDGAAFERGAVGAGTGTVCFGWKGGIGSASRVIPEGHVVGCLVQSNFGRGERLIVAGVPVGERLRPPERDPGSGGSVMIVLATDAPASERQLHRLAVRAAVGLARTGSEIAATSGDFVVAFAVPPPAATAPLDEAASLPPLLEAAAEVVEAAVIDSLFAATTTRGRDGHLIPALPTHEVAALVHRASV